MAKGSFWGSFWRETGKNTGKWTSNKVFGSGWSTPHKFIIEKENNSDETEKEDNSDETSHKTDSSEYRDTQNITTENARNIDFVSNDIAGTDLSNIKTEDIVVKDSCLSITIPAAKILTTIVNPSDFDIYIDDGNWSDEEVKGIKVTALKRIELLAISDELLKKASERTKLLLTQFFKSIGFKQVTVIEIE